MDGAPRELDPYGHEHWHVVPGGERYVHLRRASTVRGIRRSLAREPDRGRYYPSAGHPVLPHLGETLGRVGRPPHRRGGLGLGLDRWCGRASVSCPGQSSASGTAPAELGVEVRTLTCLLGGRIPSGGIPYLGTGRRAAV